MNRHFSYWLPIFQTVQVDYELIYLGYNGTLSIAYNVTEMLFMLTANQNFSLVGYSTESEVYSNETNYFNETEFTTMEILSLEFSQPVDFSQVLDQSLIDTYRQYIDVAIYELLVLVETGNSTVNSTFIGAQTTALEFDLEKDPERMPWIECDIDSVSQALKILQSFVLVR